MPETKYPDRPAIENKEKFMRRHPDTEVWYGIHTLLLHDQHCHMHSKGPEMCGALAGGRSFPSLLLPDNVGHHNSKKIGTTMK